MQELAAQSETNHRLRPRTAILHYSAPPVVGGVEAVMEAHVRTFLQAGYPAGVFSGRGEAGAFPSGADFTRIPEMDTQHVRVLEISQALEKGEVTQDFHRLVDELEKRLHGALDAYQIIIAHNLFTKHFNLPLTAAVYRLLDSGLQKRWISWCHDASWTSENSRRKLHPGYPWDLLRTYRPDISYVAVSRKRQQELVNLYGCEPEEVRVVYNGVDPGRLLGLTPEGELLAGRLGLLESDLVLLMPVRVTRAKNIELAIRVTAALKGQRLNPRLILTGPPDPHDADNMDYYHSLLALRKELGVEREMRFVFESGPEPGEDYIIEQEVVADLYRMSDLVFLPSHREGFGMPVLEAALLGLPVVASRIPAVEEIGLEDVVRVEPGDAPEEIAGRILRLMEGIQAYRLGRKVRQNYTWEAIFRRDIEPLLQPAG